MANIIGIHYINNKIENKLDRRHKKKIAREFFARWRKLLSLSFRYNFLYFKISPHKLYNKGREIKIHRFFDKNKITY